jgi:hypothetical protein
MTQIISDFLESGKRKVESGEMKVESGEWKDECEALQGKYLDVIEERS